MVVIILLPVKDWSRGYGLPGQRLEVMDYTDTTIAEVILSWEWHLAHETGWAGGSAVGTGAVPCV